MTDGPNLKNCPTTSRTNKTRQKITGGAGADGWRARQKCSHRHIFRCQGLCLVVSDERGGACCCYDERSKAERNILPRGTRFSGNTFRCDIRAQNQKAAHKFPVLFGHLGLTGLGELIRNGGGGRDRCCRHCRRSIQINHAHLCPIGTLWCGGRVFFAKFVRRWSEHEITRQSWHST